MRILVKKRKILIVEDVELNRDILCDIMSDEWDVVDAGNGEEALRKISENPDISVILLDLEMPVMDGRQVLNEMRSNGMLDKYPVIILTSDNDDINESLCLELGAMAYIIKPLQAKTDKTRIMNIADVFESRNLLTERVIEQNIELEKKNEKLEKLNDEIISMLGEVVEMRNQESGLHIKRVKGLTEILANEMQARYPEYGLDEGKIKLIVAASVLHDVGKLMIPDAVLLKPGKLTDEERSLMETHTTLGCQVLDKANCVWEDEYNIIAKEICSCHHERYDGRGYPNHLAGDDIPVSAQIVSLADVYDALVTERCYKKPFPPDKAFEMIVNGECGKFSDKLISCFVACREEIEKMIQ